MTSLPAEGRKGKAPAWPLPPDPRAAAKIELGRERVASLRDDWAAAASSREARALAKQLEQAELGLRELELTVKSRYEQESALWADLWKMPQAVQWERFRWTREVAQYVRHKVLAELGDLNHAKEARLRGETLGLTPLSMLKLRWTIASDEVAERRQAKDAAAAKSATASGARSRRGPLRAVEPPKAAGDD